jgi:hypothetical protein
MIPSRGQMTVASPEIAFNFRRKALLVKFDVVELCLRAPSVLPYPTLQGYLLSLKIATQGSASSWTSSIKDLKHRRVGRSQSSSP